MYNYYLKKQKKMSYLFSWFYDSNKNLNNSSKFCFEKKITSLYIINKEFIQIFGLTIFRSFQIKTELV